MSRRKVSRMARSSSVRLRGGSKDSSGASSIRRSSSDIRSGEGLRLTWRRLEAEILDVHHALRLAADHERTLTTPQHEAADRRNPIGLLCYSVLIRGGFVEILGREAKLALFAAVKNCTGTPPHQIARVAGRRKGQANQGVGRKPVVFAVGADSLDIVLDEIVGVTEIVEAHAVARPAARNVRALQFLTKACGCCGVSGAQRECQLQCLLLSRRGLAEEAREGAILEPGPARRLCPDQTAELRNADGIVRRVLARDLELRVGAFERTLQAEEGGEQKQCARIERVG